VSSDRVLREPTRHTPSIPTSTPEIPSDPVTTPPAPGKDAVPRKPKPPPRRVRFALPEVIPDPGPREKEYMVDRLVDAQMNDMGQILYQVRWLGYDPSDDTREEKDELPTHFIRRYWHTKRLWTLEGNILYSNDTSGPHRSRPSLHPSSSSSVLDLPSPLRPPPHRLTAS
jgi:Chromo (CHRromatin Organisation MOdifier) domain